MPRPIRTPRLNNNDDFVRLTQIVVKVGAEVRVGEILAEVETDKANFSVEAEDAGFVLELCHQAGDEIAVGSILLWLGDSPNETIPAVEENKSVGSGVSLKAQLLLRQHNLAEEGIPRAGERLTAEDVESFLKSKGLNHSAPTVPSAAVDLPLTVAGKIQELNPQERGMLRTVLWHRDSAVPGYLEFPYDARPWINYAGAFQREHKLMFDPLLSLLAFRLVGLAREHVLLNSTIVGQSRHLYDHVNLGFTVQAGSTLYMVVVQKAETMTEREFVDKLMALQIAALKKTLRSTETQDATLAFTSMARWSVSRHIPILPPHVSFIAAHVGAAPDGSGQWGATYDHRVLTGFDVAQFLRELSRPPELSEGNR